MKNGYIKCGIVIYNGLLFGSFKKITQITTWINLKNIILSNKISKRLKKKKKKMSDKRN